MKFHHSIAASTINQHLPHPGLLPAGEPLTGSEPQAAESEGDTGSRIISLSEQVTPDLATRVVLRLLQYETQHPGQPIHMFIYSPGGCVVSGLRGHT